MSQFDDRSTEINCENGTKITPFVCLLHFYEKGVSPKSVGQSLVQINSYLDIRNIREINVIERYMSFDIRLSFNWVDNRVVKKFANENVEMWEGTESAGAIVLPTESLKEFWLPDLYIFNLKKIESSKIMPSTNSLSILYNYYWEPDDYYTEYTKNNTVMEYNLERSVTVYCLDFDFNRYPFEENICTFLLHSDNPADFILLDDNSISGNNLRKLVNGYSITDITWINKSPEKVNQDWDFLSLGNAVGFTVSMKRKITPFIIQYYIPSAFLIFGR